MATTWSRRMMEHNSNYVPWHALCQDILPKFGIRVCSAGSFAFDPDTGELDLAHLASQVDDRTKLVCCTGASNFLGTKNSPGLHPTNRCGEWLSPAGR